MKRNMTAVGIAETKTAGNTLTLDKGSFRTLTKGGAFALIFLFKKKEREPRKKLQRRNRSNRRGHLPDSVSSLSGVLLPHLFQGVQQIKNRPTYPSVFMPPQYLLRYNSKISWNRERDTRGLTKGYYTHKIVIERNIDGREMENKF